MQFVFVIIAIVGILGIIFAFYKQYKLNKTIDRLEKMLDDAIKDNFNERVFDESKISKLETKLADFLSSSKLSSKQIKIEQDRIKTLIADISHQTKTPIANIMLYSELLNDCKLDEDGKSFVNQITNQSEKLDFLISSLVNLSRLENGIIAISAKKQDIKPMLDEAVKSVSPLANAKNITINYHDINNSDAFFDRKWTFEALMNILDNAVKYTGENGHIDISITEFEMFLCIEISDNGIGISDDELPKIFKRFYRSGDVSEHLGVGIGLYLARSIISAEDGYIKVSSKLDKGTAFSVFLKK